MKSLIKSVVIVGILTRLIGVACYQLNRLANPRPPVSHEVLREGVVAQRIGKQLGGTYYQPYEHSPSIGCSIYTEQKATRKRNLKREQAYNHSHRPYVQENVSHRPVRGSDDDSFDVRELK